LRAFADRGLDDVVHLKDDEYFVMGDNSPHSKDSRLWGGDTDVDLADEALVAAAGVVPERFMLGKAFFVYWPAGYKPPILPIRAVPNFGDMRFIR
jgi:signal peptidase I